MNDSFARLSFLVAITLISTFFIPRITNAAEPTEYEQYMLELINRARANPSLEVTRTDQLHASQPGYWGSFTGFDSYEAFVGPASLNEGPPMLGGIAYTIPATAKQPLAFNMKMIDATREYATLMQAQDSVSHTIDGTTVNDRLTSKGYTTELARQSGQNNHFPGSENNSFTATSESWDVSRYSGDVRKEAIELMHQILFTDALTTSKVHRMTMLASDWRESGIAFSFGADPGLSSVYGNHAFGLESDSGPFITGVAYNDINNDQFFTPETGEALAQLEISVYRTGTQNLVAQTTTFASGGYGLNVPANATFDVRFQGTNIDQTFKGVIVTSDNVKVDAIDPLYQPPVVGPALDFSVSSITLTGHDVTITWNSTVDTSYRVRRSTDLKNWSIIDGSVIAANGGTSSYTHVNGALGAHTCFYLIDQLQ